MNITDIKIRRIYTEGRLRALVSVTVDSALAIHDIKIIDGSERLFVAMPSRKEADGTFRDIIHPITADARKELEERILEYYHAHMIELENIDAENIAIEESEV